VTQNLGQLGKVDVFFLDTGAIGDAFGRLYRSDGTRAGTFPLIASGPASPRPCSDLENGLVFGGALFFRGRTDADGCALWRTDGTVAGTRLVKSFEILGEQLRDLTPFAGKLYFSAVTEDGTYGLWASDGTEAGTALVRSMQPPRFLTVVGSRLYFVAYQDGDELWVSDGTAAGTKPLTDFVAPSPFWGTFFLGIDGVLYFLADDVTGGLDLWRSDGTPAGTRRVTAFGNATPFSNRFSAQQIAKLGSRLIFVATDGIAGYRLWTSGGTPETTAPLTACPGAGCIAVDPTAQLVKIGNQVVFPGIRSGGQAGAWITDGTAAGTRPLPASCTPHCGPKVTGFAPVAGRVLFVLGDDSIASEHPQELWQTDGTASGTRWLATLSPFSQLYPPFQPVAAGTRVLFIAPPRDLWVSDGTPAGTGPVTQIAADGFGSDPHGFAGDGSTVWFSAYDGQSPGLWHSDGTASTTQRMPVTDPEQIAVAHSLAFYLQYDGTFSRLWRSDGTADGTISLTPEGSGNATSFFNFQGQVACIVAEPGGVTALWESDGTPDGTRRLLTIPLEPGQTLDDVAAVGSSLFFLAKGPANSQRFLWRSDGTPGGTRAIDLGGRFPLLHTAARLGDRIFFLGGFSLYSLADAASSLQTAVSNVQANQMAAFQGALYLAQSHRLTKSDGTAGGTAVLKTFDGSDLPFSFNFWLTPAASRLYFVMQDAGHGAELWSTDGTAAGTVLVKDINPGSTSSSPASLVAVGGRVFFSADDGVHGFELWESDGTDAGTRMVQDIAPGVPSAQPQELTVAGGRLYFSADDGVRGREPWVLPLAGPAGCQPSDQVLCLGGGRYQVQVEWQDFAGHVGPGHAVSLTADTGTFWFFDPSNVELVLKVLDGTGVNGHLWVFYGALSNVEYSVTVTDTQTGAARLYRNPQGRLGSLADTLAFDPLGTGGASTTLGPEAETWQPVTTESRTAAAGCVPSSTRLCLQDGRFAVEAHWRDFQNKTGAGTAVPLAGGDTGYFWFFGPTNVEVILKVLDGRPVNGKIWVFYGALSNVEYTLTVTDTQTGKFKTYFNPRGRLSSAADTGAF
jgi:ELWxxDGT repeat protein